MEKQNKVVIVLARCCQHRKLYGLRVEEKSVGLWLADWAFPIQEKTAMREGFDKTTIPAFGVDGLYPGCPYCGNRNYFQCSCNGKLTCWDGESKESFCAWGNHPVLLDGRIERIDAGSDR